MEEALENGKELSHSAHGNGMNESTLNNTLHIVITPSSHHTHIQETPT
jgi:hypothetical protein